MTGARWGLRTAVAPWLAARVAVLAALAVAHELASDGRLTARSAATVHAGLLAWDAGWYEAIAKHGYAGAGTGALRFFPLLPALARGLSEVPGISVGTALILIANISALGATATLCCLVRRETGDEKLARRAAWLLCLAPPAFTFVMGYAEATFLFLAIGSFYAMRQRRWWLAALLGVLAGLDRPLGALLVVPAAIECMRAWNYRNPTMSKHIGSIATVLAGPAGCGGFMAFVGLRYGDAFAPLRIQQEAGHRGAIADPFRTLAHDASLLLHGQHLGTALHLPWVLLALVLVVVAARRWPAPYAAFAFCVLAVALTASNLDSFERYALSAFPLALGAASIFSKSRTETAVFVLAAAGLVSYAVLAFTGLYVP